jgi:hypothetical protein
MNYYGNFYYGDIQSNINVEMSEKLARFYLVSETFENLKFLKKFKFTCCCRRMDV